MARDLRANVRVHLRFAAVLLAALAASLLLPAPDLALNVALFAASGASGALVLTFCFRRGAPSWLSATILVLAFAAGLVASLAARPALALACQGIAAAYILVMGVSRVRDDPTSGIAALLGAVSLVLGGLATMDGAPAQAGLFFAAALALVARALQKPVADADAGVELLVGGKRA